MPIKVTLVAEIVEHEIILSRQSKHKPGDIVEILTNLEPVKDPRDERWTLELFVGSGKQQRLFHLPLPCLISTHDSLDNPLFFGNGSLVYFRDRLFMPERPPKNAADREEITLRVKKAVYDDETDLAGLRSEVANLEAAMGYSKSGPKRDQIPEDVKLVVWTRDGGACVRCGARQDLHFDHIIPVSKGGGNSEENIQILCKKCNLQKSDKISFQGSPLPSAHP
ncbi:MAG: HNH endonuclease [Thermoanaerobaculales bacterium]